MPNSKILEVTDFKREIVTTLNVAQLCHLSIIFTTGPTQSPSKLKHLPHLGTILKTASL